MTNVVAAGKTFEELAALFKENPEEFERLRKEVLEEEILKYPEERRARLRAILFNLDTRLRHHGSGIARYNAIVADLLGARVPALSNALKDLGREARKFQKTVDEFRGFVKEVSLPEEKKVV
ncbi:MAG: DUF3135 domain-containing protein [Patescibacteria group bacterium]